MKSTKMVFCMALCAALLIVSAGAALAQQADQSAGFAIRAIMPANQMDQSVGYYYFSAEPGETQTLEMLIFNREEEEIRVRIEANTAFTNANGVIDYTYQEERDASLMVDFASHVTIEEPILMIPAHGEVIAEIEIQMPEEVFEGEILGGLVVQKLPPQEPEAASGASTEQASKGLAITNVFVYTIAVRIRGIDEVIEPAFEMQGAQMIQIAGYPALKLDIRNPQPRIIKDLTLDVQVVEEESGETVLSFRKESCDMAPNTLMQLSHVLIGEKPLPSGDYRVLANLQYDETAWAFDLPMVVKDQ